MSKECDVFSDSYGCIITKCIGYQAPFPIVRLSNGGEVALPNATATVQGACFVSTLTDQSAPRGRLLTLDLSTADACVSFLHLLDPSRRPVVLEAKTAFVQKVAVEGLTSAVVSRGGNGRSSAAVYVAQPDTPQRCARVVFRHVTAAALRSETLWLAATPKTRAAGEAGLLQLHRCPVVDALSGAPLTAVAAPRGASTGPILDVVALTAETAVVVAAAAVAVADCRAGTAHIAVAASAPIVNGGVADREKVVTFDSNSTLRVFDLRSTARPLLSAATSSYVCVKAAVDCRAALLVTGDVTGVLDLQTLATAASLQHWGDTVLDAALLPQRNGGARVCTSTASGMLYDWTMAM